MGHQLEGAIGTHSKRKLMCIKVPSCVDWCHVQFAEYGLRYVCRSIGMIGDRVDPDYAFVPLPP